MKLGQMNGARREFAVVRDDARRWELLLAIGAARVPGLLVWHFGAGGETRDARDIPVARIEHFLRFYVRRSA